MTRSGSIPYAASSRVEREVGREHGRLGDVGLHELGAEAVERVGVVVVAEDERGEGAAEERGHHPVGLGEGLGDDGLGGDEIVEHVDVLRALAGEEEGDLGCRTPPEEHSCAGGASSTIAGLPVASAVTSGPALPARSAASAKSTATRTAAPARAGSGAAAAGAVPACAATRAARIWARTSAVAGAAEDERAAQRRPARAGCAGSWAPGRGPAVRGPGSPRRRRSARRGRGGGRGRTPPGRRGSSSRRSRRR